jgi:hypothetical protein
MYTYQPSEIVCLILILALLPVGVRMTREAGIPHRRTLMILYVFMISAYTATIVEGFIFLDFFNAIEHLSLAGAGVAAAVAAFQLRRSYAAGQGDVAR